MQPRSSRRVQFESADGTLLAAIVDATTGPSSATVVLSHCFTCGKDLKAIVRLSRRLAELGMTVVRYDWTGIGESGGRFADTSFSSGVADVLAASRYARTLDAGPCFLFGYSLGGAASLAAASMLSTADVQGIVTLGAPSDTFHLADLLERMNPRIQSEGSGLVAIGGRSWEIRPSMLDDLRSYDLASRLDNVRRSVLVYHSPEDETVAYWHARALLEKLGSRCSLLALPGADHLLTKHPADLEFIAQTMHAWIQRCIA